MMEGEGRVCAVWGRELVSYITSSLVSKATVKHLGAVVVTSGRIPTLHIKSLLINRGGGGGGSVVAKALCY
jgi:hypothetical protein